MAKVASSWNFMIHFNFTPYEIEEKLLHQRYSSLAGFCAEIRTHVIWEPCKLTIKTLNATLNEITGNNKILKQLFKTNSRSNRGIVNGIGRLLKFLFGTMDDEDAALMESTLKKLHANQNKLHHNIEARTSVIINTIEAIGKFQNNLNDQFKILQDNMNKFDLNYKNLTECYKTLHLFDEASNLMTLSMQQFLTKQSELTDILHEAQAGKIDKHIIISPWFIEALAEVQSELPHDSQFPLKPTMTNLQLFDKIIQFSPLYAAGELTLSVSIPLVSNFYQLYRLTSIPVRYGENYYYNIQPSTEYVAVNEQLKRYVLLQQHEIDKCTNINNNLHLCKQNFVVHSQNSQHCIIKLILNNRDLEACNIELFKSTQEVWYPLIKSNTWLYVLPNNTNLRIICKKELYKMKIFMHNMQ